MYFAILTAEIHRDTQGNNTHKKYATRYNNNRYSYKGKWEKMEIVFRNEKEKNYKIRGGGRG